MHLSRSVGVIGWRSCWILWEWQRPFKKIEMEDILFDNNRKGMKNIFTLIDEQIFEDTWLCVRSSFLKEELQGLSSWPLIRCWYNTGYWWLMIYDLFMRTHLRCIKCLLITHFCFAQIFMWNSSKGERTFDFWIDDRVESVASRKTQYLNMGLIITRGFLFLTNHSTIVQRVSFNMKSARVWSSAVYLFSSNQIECVMAGVLFWY